MELFLFLYETTLFQVWGRGAGAGGEGKGFRSSQKEVGAIHELPLLLFACDRGTFVSGISLSKLLPSDRHAWLLSVVEVLP